jgi:hypothetical protein
MERDCDVSSDNIPTVEDTTGTAAKQGFDGWRKTQAEDVATAVIEAVATEKGTDELDLEPLGDVVDPDALGQVFAGRTGVRGHISFEYENCLVQVDSDGRVTAIEQ